MGSTGAGHDNLHGVDVGGHGGIALHHDHDSVLLPWLEQASAIHTEQ